jgi:hypothetical protein
MKHTILLVTLLFARTVFAHDETTSLISVHDHEFDTIVLEDALTLRQAHEKGKIHANSEGYLICINSNLVSCDGLSKFKKTLRLDRITHCDFSRNKIAHLHGEFFTALPNLTHLNLADNDIGIVYSPIPPHQNLKTVYLQKNNLKKFPFQEFLQNIPVKQLWLDENQITDYGSINTNLPSLEELWLDPTVGFITKMQIGKHCTNLTAEICEGDTLIQDVHTKFEFDDACIKESKKTAFIAGAVGSVFGACAGGAAVFICRNSYV